MTPLLTGLGLAAAAGWNAWVVLLLFNGLIRLLPQEFPGPTSAFLSSRMALTVAVVLFLAEFIVDKIPFADRLWDLAHTLLRPLVGALLALACHPEDGLLGLVAVGGGGALSTLAAHVARSTSRLTSTAATRGPAQFAHSLAEDVVAVVLATLAFFIPWFTALLLAALAALLFTHRARVRAALAVLFFQLQHPRRTVAAPPAEPHG